MLEKLGKALEDRYTISREIGRGGMATVYLAEDFRHGRDVAVKVLHPDLASALGTDRFLREIRLAARLNHPHILPLFDSGAADGFLYYVMPYIEGESLREELNRDRKIPLDEALAIARSVAAALDYANRSRIVHRDIKPENIMLNEGEAMVMDFGIAKALTAAAADTLTQVGMVVGTPAYVSPEQAAGEIDIDGRSDQYSLACVVYEMLSGDRPFNGPTAQAVLNKRFTEPAPSLREVMKDVPGEIDARIVQGDVAGRGCPVLLVQRICEGAGASSSHHSSVHDLCPKECAGGQVDRGAALHEHERRPVERVLHGRNGGGDHQRPVEDQVARASPHALRPSRSRARPKTSARSERSSKCRPYSREAFERWGTRSV